MFTTIVSGPGGGYAPLAHQIMALLSFLFGISLPFGILAIATSLFLIWTTQRFASALGMQSRTLPWIVALAPGVYVFLYVFGQLPALLSTAFVLASCSFLGQYLDSGGTKKLLLAALLAALSFFAHELITVELFPLLIIVLIFKSHGIAAIRRLLLWGVLSLAVASPVMLNIIDFIRSTPRQAPIPHLSRTDFLVGPPSIPFFWGIYGPLMVLLPLSLFTLVEFRKSAYLLVTGVYIVFGLGGVTPVPLIILGPNVYNWLTFEIFAFFAMILLAIPLGASVDRLMTNSGWLRRRLSLFLVLSLLLSAVGGIAGSYATILPVARPNVQGISTFLNSQQGEGFYVTLGLGPTSKALSLMTTKPTLDGGYNTARRLPALAQSGVESMDTAKYFPNGITFVRQVLNGSFGVRWVILGDSVYQPLLVQAGYGQVEKIAGSLPVTIWENGDKQGDYGAISTSNDSRSYSWGLVPILTLFAAMLIAVKMK